MSGAAGEVVERLLEAINRGDVEGALSLYAEDAVFVAQPGQLARGRAQIRAALSGFIALKPTLTFAARQVIEAGDVALYVARWQLRGTDAAGAPVVMAGESADILRRQPDGRWLIVLDNPWGTQLLQ